jgi:hypothetical protein
MTRAWMGLVGLVVVGCGVLVGPGVAFGSGGVAGWSVHAVPEPSSFSATTSGDRYQLLIENTGVEASHGEVTVTDTLPVGITTLGTPSVGEGGVAGGWECSEGAHQPVVTCRLSTPVEGPKGEPVEGSIRAGHYGATIDIGVSQPAEGALGPLVNEARVEGGGLASGSTREETPVGRPAVFEVHEFVFEPGMAGGVPVGQAGGHPWELTSTLGIPTADSPPNGQLRLVSPTRTLKNVAVELPVGFLGDPLATVRCEESQLRTKHCPAASRIGVYGIVLGETNNGQFTATEDTDGNGCCSAIYNLAPEGGYPAEFGFTFAENVPIVMTASVVHTGTGYRVRVNVPDISSPTEPYESTLTFFGEPGALNGSGSKAAFMSSPDDCSAESEHLWSSVSDTAPGNAARLEIEPWGVPGDTQTAETTGYPGLTGCRGLTFDPSFSLTPSPSGAGAAEEGTTQPDEPSAYDANLTLPQTTEFSEFATPDLKNSTVVLPAGVTASPSAATGLEACQATGPDGINIGSSEIGAFGQDIGDPEATELGEGHAGPGGNDSPYDDGFYHAAKGHCPEGSILGSVEVCTPLLPNHANGSGVKTEGEQYCETNPGVAPLEGHIYLGEPECGGPGQEECSNAYAEGKGAIPNNEGKLFKLYIEVEGDGVIAKLPGTVTANPTTGQLTSTFKEAPQLAFGQLKIHFKGGPRASLANPQTCGTFTTTSVLEPWSHLEANETLGTPNATPSSSFAIGGCPATMPFNPGFVADTLNPQAGAYSPFVLAFSREDGEQDFSGLTETMPPGLVGKIAGIKQCGEAEANAGTCSEASEIGTTSALAGPGTQPFSVTGGHVYLTGPYDGAPFGLSIVVPTKAGPFNLGNEIVRAAVHINPNTAQVTVTTNPLPQSKDGIPFRLRSVTTQTKEGFLLNPTSCTAKSVTATITAAQGATANVSAPFEAKGCQNLPFTPSFEVSSKAKTSKANGASLTVKVSQAAGQANIAKVDLTIPKILPSRLTTIQKACLAATFEANPANCPEGSVIGTGTAITPLLGAEQPLTGPAYLVSHGGAEFPDVEFVLQGENITIILDGKTDIKKGVTYSRFETVPDSPVTSFETNLPEGPHSALTTEKPGETNLCATTTTKSVTVKKKVTERIHGKLKKITKTTKKTTTTATPAITIPTVITAQNGAVITQNTPVHITGCPTTKPPKPKPTAKTHKTKKPSKKHKH